MKPLLFVCILISLSVALSADAESLKKRRGQEDNNFFTVEGIKKNREKVSYDIRNRAKDLHRKAIKAFYLADFKDSEACFSLSMNAWSNSSKLLFEFALCSSLYPKPYRSFDRTKELLKMYQSKVKKSDQRVYIIEGIIAWQKGDLKASRGWLEKVKNESALVIVASKMLKNIELKRSLLSLELVEKLMPVRLSSNEKRSQRN